MSEQDLQGTLDRIGSALDLGEYEIEIYLAVIEHGELTTTEITDHTDVPQPRVYDTVRDLADRGLVDIQESRPMRVIARDPEEAFAEIETSLDHLVSGLEERYTAPATGAEAVALVKSRATILKYLEEVIEHAEYELILSLTPRLLERFAEDLAAAIDRGATVELIVTPATEAPGIGEFDYTRVASTARARRGITTPVLAVADGEYAVYATQDAVRDGTEEYGVIFNRSTLGFLVSGFFWTVLWTTADEVLAEDRPRRSFPRRYASIRRCVKDLRDLDTEVFVRIEGRDVETGDSRTVRGKVESTHFTEDQEVATLVVETANGPVEVGGRVASYEEVEAHEITLDVDSIP